MRTWIALVLILASASTANAQTPSQSSASSEGFGDDPYAYERSWTARMGFRWAWPKGQLANETSSGWQGSFGLYRSLTPSFSLGLKFDTSRFNGADTMPSDFSASQIRMSIDTVYNFQSFGDGRVTPFVSAGAGLARNTLNFGESSVSEWKPGVSVGSGLDVGFHHSDNVSMGLGTAYFVSGHIGFDKFENFQSVGAGIDLKIKWGGQ